MSTWVVVAVTQLFALHGVTAHTQAPVNPCYGLTVPVMWQYTATTMYSLSANDDISQ